MVKRIVSLMLIGCALWQWDVLSRRRLASSRSTPAAKPPDVTRWEGEGGALPDTGSQLGPEPAQP
jgi:hypothetical protein